MEGTRGSSPHSRASEPRSEKLRGTVLSSRDSLLARRQARLPGLTTVLDPLALAAAASLHGLRLPEGCAPSYVRFKPGTSCLVGYASAESNGPALFYATAFERNSRKLVKAMERRTVHSERGPGRIVLDPEAIEVCVFPNDDHMQVLVRLADPERRQKIVRRLWRDRSRVDTIEARTIAYKPERRCVMRITAGDGSTALLKAYAKGAFEPAYARARHFCSAPRIQGLQRLIGVDERRRLLAMEWLPGASLVDLLQQPESAATFMKKAGALLAQLHASPPDSLPKWTARTAARELREILATLAALLPEESERAAELARRVLLAVAADSPVHVALHGDFDPRQVVVDGESVAFVDLDEAVAGPPALDIGTFIARLHMSAARQDVSETTAADAAAALLAGYAATRSPPSVPSVRAFTAFAFLKIAHEPFRRYRREWPAEVSAVLARAERLFEPEQ